LSTRQVLWWNWMIAIAVLAEDIYCLYLPSLLYPGLTFCLSCLECPSVRIAIKSLKNTTWKPEVKLNGTLWKRTHRGRAVSGETEIRSARDPSPPVFSPVGFRATPVRVRTMQNSTRSMQTSDTGPRFLH